MGTVLTPVTIYSMDLSRSETLTLIVDTGSTLTWIPEEVALRLGLRPERDWVFRTIEGEDITRPVGPAMIECAGDRTPVRVVFAREKDLPVLGVTVLELLGLQVDPYSQVLRKSDAAWALAA
jgi:predicted aspartyl protease